ncbi:MAG TPA: hypothetical protein VE953_21260 [Terriglobales bacterium]|nr:hypothetical protein [Terriglobales bacterium]
MGFLAGARLAPPVPSWLVLTLGVASLSVALVQLAQVGVDNLLTLLALLGVFWLLGGVLELADLAVEGRRWPWRLAGAAAGVAAGVAVLREPLWSTLLVPALLAPTVGWLGIAAGLVSLLRGLLGGGPGALVLGALSVVLGVVLVLAAPAAIVWFGAAAAAVGGAAAVVVAVGAPERPRAERSRELAG